MYTAVHRFARISPRKVRIVADLVRGKKIEEALTILQFNVKRGSHFITKVVNSAVANATSQDANADDLRISEIYVDEGPTIKRWRPRAMGRATPINKKTSHIHVKLS